MTSNASLDVVETFHYSPGNISTRPEMYSDHLYFVLQEIMVDVEPPASSTSMVISMAPDITGFCYWNLYIISALGYENLWWGKHESCDLTPEPDVMHAAPFSVYFQDKSWYEPLKSFNGIRMLVTYHEVGDWFFCHLYFVCCKLLRLS